MARLKNTRWLIPWALAFIGITGATVIITLLVKPAGDKTRGALAEQRDESSYLKLRVRKQSGETRRLWPGSALARGSTVVIDYSTAATHAVVVAVSPQQATVLFPQPRSSTKIEPAVNRRLAVHKVSTGFIRYFFITSLQPLNVGKIAAAADSLGADPAALAIPPGASAWSLFASVH